MPLWLGESTGQSRVSVVLDGLMEKLPATFLGREGIDNFVKHMAARVERGKEKYPVTYRFDPLTEAMEECVDIANYSMILYWRLANLKEKLSVVRKEG